ncbi:hypothetical protein GCM10027091_70800 [Streptomyces daliensis]
MRELVHEAYGAVLDAAHHEVGCVAVEYGDGETRCGGPAMGVVEDVLGVGGDENGVVTRHALLLLVSG